MSQPFSALPLVALAALLASSPARTDDTTSPTDPTPPTATAPVEVTAPTETAPPTVSASTDSTPPPPAASAPGITVTATALKHDGNQIRTYWNGDAISPWFTGLPVYRGDVFRVTVFQDVRGKSAGLTFKLDGQSRAANPGDASSYDIDTSALAVRDHMIQVAQKSGKNVAFTFLAVDPPSGSDDSDASPLPIPDPWLRPVPNKPHPPAPWKDTDVDTDTEVRVSLRVATPGGEYDPKAQIHQPLIITNQTDPRASTYIEVLPSRAFPDVTKYVFSIVRNGQVIYQSTENTSYTAGPPSPDYITQLINLYRKDSPAFERGGLTKGDATLYVWGIKGNHRLSFPTAIKLSVN